MKPEAIASITAQLSPFAGTSFDVAHEKVDREQWDFMWCLEPAIRKAAWVQLDWVGGFTFKKQNWPGDHVYGEMGVINVSVELHEENRTKLLPAAEALAAALRSIGVTANVEQFNNSSTNPAAIHLLVGSG